MQPAPPTRRAPVLLLISGPSGSGKTTVAQGLLARYPQLRRVVTCTTRPPRPGERHGREYYFLKREEFLARIESGAFIEHAEVYGNLYGTPKAELLEQLAQGRDLVLNVDVQGARSLRAFAAAEPTVARALATVFLVAADRAELERRLARRATENAEQFAARLQAAMEETAEAKAFDYTVVSGTMEEDLDRVSAIYAAETLRTSRRRVFP